MAAAVEIIHFLSSLACAAIGIGFIVLGFEIYMISFVQPFVIGVLTFMIAVIGCFATAHRSPTILMTYSIAMFMDLIVQAMFWIRLLLHYRPITVLCHCIYGAAILIEPINIGTSVIYRHQILRGID